MKYVFVITIVLLTLGASASAQSDRAYQYYFEGHGVFVTEPDFWTDYYGSGIGIGFGIEYPTSPAWTLVAGLSINSFGLNKSELETYYVEDYGASDVDISGGRAMSISFSVLGKTRLNQESDAMSPYFKGGFGLTNISGSDAEVEYLVGDRSHYDDPGLESSTNLSITLGFGLEFPLGDDDRHWYIDLGYHLVMTDPDNTGGVPISVGLTF